MRVEAGIFPDDRGRYGVVLGKIRSEGRRPRSKPGMWKGHLVAVSEGHLLDATIDQAQGIEIEPLVVSVPPWWFKGDQAVFLSIADCLVRYTAFPNLGGFRSAPDFRPSRRQEIVRRLSREFANGRC
jgi:hypothetical protein